MKVLILASLLIAMFQTVCERSSVNSASTASTNANVQMRDQQENKMKETNGNVQQILQLTLDLPKLQAYFHPDSPKRKPLYVIENDQVGDVKLEKFGEPVKFTSAADAKAKDIPAFEFTSVKIEGPNATVQFRYRVEGIRGKASFKSTDGKWEVTSSELVES